MSLSHATRHCTKWLIVQLSSLGIIAIIGGIFALKRRIWGLALTGAYPCPIRV